MKFDKINVRNSNGILEIFLFSDGKFVLPRLKFMDGKFNFYYYSDKERGKENISLEELTSILKEYVPMDLYSLVGLIQNEVDFIIKDNLEQYEFDVSIINESDPRYLTYLFKYKDSRDRDNIITYRRIYETFFIIDTSFKYKDKEIQFTYHTSNLNIIDKEENKAFINNLIDNKILVQE